jgi:serine phosphatase RsbU (regulator of sigma subunit)/pSer/pThr/pTyr-binding forkhead associated (FHA) protein
MRMSAIVILRGPESGRQYPIVEGRTILGRNAECDVTLAGKQISRQHAHLYAQEGKHLLEDLGSSNGTFLNGMRIAPRTPCPLTERDTFQIGPYLLGLRPAQPPAPETPEPSLVVRETISATSLDEKLFAQDPATKLQVVLDIAQQLARTLELDPLLEKLLEQLMKLLPQADRVMVILCEQDKLMLRAQRTRPGRDLSALSFSRTIVQRALTEGIGMLSEDLQSDQRYEPSHSIMSLDLHSILCVPLINLDGKRLGVIQADRFCKGFGFRVDDLHLVTAIGKQVAVVLENVALHAEKLREDRLLQELAMARDIQEGYLPEELEGFPDADFEIFGQVFPARQVAGDFYDFVRTPAGRLAFFIGDVSGKGMPAALFMVAVRTLCRHLVKEVERPGQLLAKLNAELADDNPTCMFVTLAHGLYDPATGRVLLASAGHPTPMLRRAAGAVEEIPLKPGRLLGYSHEILQFPEAHIQLDPGDTLCFFTDGLLEACTGRRLDMFGLERINKLVSTFTPERPLADCTDAAKLAVDRFTGAKELQDDLTLLMLRRLSPSATDLTDTDHLEPPS